MHAPLTPIIEGHTYGKAPKGKGRRDQLPTKPVAEEASASAVAVPLPRAKAKAKAISRTSASTSVTPPPKRKDDQDVPTAKKQRTKRGSEKRKGLAATLPSQADALDLAYQSNTRMFATQKVVFIPGTDVKNADDLQDDLLVMEGKVRETKRYKYMRKMIARLPYKPLMFVGHSLGAAIARALGEDLLIPHTGYEDPTPTWERGEPGNFRSKWDPLTQQNLGAITDDRPTFDPHGYRNKAKYRSVTLLPNAPDDL